MKQLLLRVLVAGASLAFFVAPGWAGQAVVLSDTELEGIAAGDGLELQDEFTDGDLHGKDNALSSTNTLNGPISLSGTDQSGQGSSFSTNMSDTSSAQVNQNSAIITPESDEFFQVLNDQSQQYVQVPYLLNSVGSTNAFLINNEDLARSTRAATHVREPSAGQQDDRKAHAGTAQPARSIQTSIAYSQHTEQGTGQGLSQRHKKLAPGKTQRVTNSAGGNPLDVPPAPTSLGERVRSGGDTGDRKGKAVRAPKVQAQARAVSAPKAQEPAQAQQVQPAQASPQEESPNGRASRRSEGPDSKPQGKKP